MSQIDEGQMLHFPHSVRQFGENITLQVKFCEVFQDMSKQRGYFSSSITARRHSVNIYDVTTTVCDTAASLILNLRAVHCLSFPTSEMSKSFKELAGDGL